MATTNVLLQVAYGTRQNYNNAAKINGTLYFITNEHRMFVKLPDLDPFELFVNSAGEANSVVSPILFKQSATQADTASGVISYDGSSPATITYATVGALPSTKGVASVAFNAQDKLVVTFNDATSITAADAFEPANATFAAHAGYVDNVATFGETNSKKVTYDGSSPTLVTLDNFCDASGLIPMKYIPSGALERIYVLGTGQTLSALTETQVQPGDIVKDNSSKKMYVVRAVGTNEQVPQGTPVNSAGTLAFEEFAVGTAVYADHAGYVDESLTLNFGSGQAQVYTYNGGSPSTIYLRNYVIAANSASDTDHEDVTGSSGVYLNSISSDGSQSNKYVKSSIKFIGKYSEDSDQNWTPIEFSAAASESNTTLSTVYVQAKVMQGATTTAAGHAGLVPHPNKRTSSSVDQFLCDDGTWKPVNDSNVYHTTGSWGWDSGNYTYTATSNGTASMQQSGFTADLKVLLPIATSTNPGGVQIGTGQDYGGLVMTGSVLSCPIMTFPTSVTDGKEGLVPAAGKNLYNQLNVVLTPAGWSTVQWDSDWNTNNHQTFLVTTGSDSGVANASSQQTNGNVYLNLVEGPSSGTKVLRSTHKISGKDCLLVTLTATNNIEIGHSVSITASPANSYTGTSSNINALNQGSSFEVPYLRFNSTGHVIEYNSATITLGSVSCDISSLAGAQKTATVLGTDIYTGIKWQTL